MMAAIAAARANEVARAAVLRDMTAVGYLCSSITLSLWSVLGILVDVRVW